MTNRKTFDINPKNTLTDDVLIEGNKNYSNTAFDEIIRSEKEKKPQQLEKNNELENMMKSSKKVNETKKTMGRPVEITDMRMKVSVPKKVSPYVSQKIDTLQPFITEFSSVTGRVTFDKILDVLIDTYTTHKLGIGKEELFKQQFQKDFDNLKKKYKV